MTSTDLLDIHPADVPRDTFYGLADRDFRKTNVDELLLRAEHDLADTVKLQGQQSTPTSSNPTSSRSLTTARVTFRTDVSGGA
ncbi:hypothetical protein ACFSHP_22410 [Novosphingobium panipatense]